MKDQHGERITINQDNNIKPAILVLLSAIASMAALIGLLFHVWTLDSFEAMEQATYRYGWVPAFALGASMVLFAFAAPDIATERAIFRALVVFTLGALSFMYWGYTLIF